MLRVMEQELGDRDVKMVLPAWLVSLVVHGRSQHPHRHMIAPKT
jgi:hypothetical protein